MGLKVGLYNIRDSARVNMLDEFGAMIPGSRVLEFPTEERARQGFNEAADRGEVQTVKIHRKYIVVE